MDFVWLTLDCWKLRRVQATFPKVQCSIVGKRDLSLFFVETFSGALPLITLEHRAYNGNAVVSASTVERRLSELIRTKGGSDNQFFQIIE